MEYFVDDIIDGTTLTLSEYLNILFSKNYKKMYPNNYFPTDEMLNEYLEIIHNVSNNDIKKIIFRFLVQEGAYGIDNLHREQLKKDRDLLIELHNDFPIYTKRLYYLGKPWEGLTWVLDLLPYYPRDVLNIIDSFTKIYCQFLPDSVMKGFSDIDQIIRAKYFENYHPIEILYNLSSYEFECVIAELYNAMKYEVELTKITHDNGIDIIAKNNDVAKKEMIVIQCKKHKQKITVKDVRELVGVIELNNATKGVFCTSSDYTNEAKKLSRSYNRIELLNAKEIIKLCNEYFEVNWPIKIGKFAQKYRGGKKNDIIR